MCQLFFSGDRREKRSTRCKNSSCCIAFLVWLRCTSIRLILTLTEISSVALFEWKNWPANIKTRLGVSRFNSSSKRYRAVLRLCLIQRRDKQLLIKLQMGCKDIYYEYWKISKLSMAAASRETLSISDYHSELHVANTWHRQWRTCTISFLYASSFA